MPQPRSRGGRSTAVPGCERRSARWRAKYNHQRGCAASQLDLSRRDVAGRGRGGRGGADGAGAAVAPAGAARGARWRSGLDQAFRRMPAFDPLGRIRWQLPASTRRQTLRHHLRRWSEPGDGGGARHPGGRGRAGDLLRARRQCRAASADRAARARRRTRRRASWDDPRQADGRGGRRDRATGVGRDRRARAPGRDTVQRLPHAARLQVVRRVRGGAHATG